MLENHIRQKLKTGNILLMTHIVIGYPDLETSREIVAAMVDAGVDLMELQIPFSEPIADGPVILKANQAALAGGITVQQCLEFAKEMAAIHDIPFLFMSYYNILFRYGVSRFAEVMSDAGIKGAIVPDLPPEEGAEYLSAMARRDLSPIFIFSPTSSIERMRFIASHAKGFVYCVARKGVTGQDTNFSRDLSGYLSRCKQATDLPLAVGFGVKDRRDVDFLIGKADIAVIGTETIRRVEQNGVGDVAGFIRGLR